jgi:40S ribosomal protein S4 C-terminus
MTGREPHYLGALGLLFSFSCFCSLAVRIRFLPSYPFVLFLTASSLRSHLVSVLFISKQFRFSTRLDNVFTIGKGASPMVSLPKGHGVKQSILDVQAKAFGTAIAAE